MRNPELVINCVVKKKASVGSFFAGIATGVVGLMIFAYFVGKKLEKVNDTVINPEKYRRPYDTYSYSKKGGENK